MNKNNIVRFPIEKRAVQIETAQLEFISMIEETTDNLVENLVVDLIELDYQIDDPNHMYDISIVYETIKSLICKMHDTYHPVQDFAYKIYNDEVEYQAFLNKQLELDF